MTITHTQKRRIEKWIDALDEYKQTTGKLRGDKGFCCLGVATDVACQVDPKLGRWERDVRGEWFFVSHIDERDHDLLPDVIANWYGFDDVSGPDLSKLGIKSHDDQVYVDGADMNDGGKRFSTIAKAMRAWLGRQKIKGR